MSKGLATIANGKHQSLKHHAVEKKQLEGVEAYTQGTLEQLKERYPHYAGLVTVEYANEKQRAQDYARKVTMGATKVEAYSKILGINWDLVNEDADYKKWMNTRCWRYEQLEIVVKEIEYVQLSMHRFFHDKHLRALNEQFNLGMTARSEKVRADALHQFIQNTRNPMLGKPTQEDVNMLAESRQLLDSITNAFKAVRGNKQENCDFQDGHYPHSVEPHGRNTPPEILYTDRNLSNQCLTDRSNMQTIDVVPLKEFP